MGSTNSSLTNSRASSDARATPSTWRKATGDSSERLRAGHLFRPGAGVSCPLLPVERTGGLAPFLLGTPLTRVLDRSGDSGFLNLACCAQALGLFRAVPCRMPLR